MQTLVCDYVWRTVLWSCSCCCSGSPCKCAALKAVCSTTNTKVTQSLHCEEDVSGLRQLWSTEAILCPLSNGKTQKHLSYYVSNLFPIYTSQAFAPQTYTGFIFHWKQQAPLIDFNGSLCDDEPLMTWREVFKIIIISIIAITPTLSLCEWETEKEYLCP